MRSCQRLKSVRPLSTSHKKTLSSILLPVRRPSRLFSRKTKQTPVVPQLRSSAPRRRCFDGGLHSSRCRAAEQAVGEGELRCDLRGARVRTAELWPRVELSVRTAAVGRRRLAGAGEGGRPRHKCQAWSSCEPHAVLSQCHCSSGGA
jgi:hypothetical protein